MPGAGTTRRGLLAGGLSLALGLSGLAWPQAESSTPSYRLAGLRFVPEQDEARKALLSEMGPLRYESLGMPDRWGETPALGFTQHGESVQALLLRAGLALVETWPGEALDPGPLYAAEDAGRQAGVGLWIESGRWRREAQDLAQDYDSLRHQFLIVHGRLASVTERRSLTYLNFGDDYRSDTSVGVREVWRSHWRDAPFALSDLAGQRVEIRGVLDRYNGPWFVLSHWQALRVLEEDHV